MKTFFRNGISHRESIGSGACLEIVRGTTLDGHVSFYLTSDGSLSGTQLYQDARVISALGVQSGSQLVPALISEDASGEMRLSFHALDNSPAPDGIQVMITLVCIPV